MSRFEICLSGSGGQGLVLAGKILAEAIALHGGKQVVQTQSYGPEARGGASRSEIVVSDDAIDYPKITRLDLLLALTQESLTKYLPNLKEGGTLVIDPFGVKNPPSGKFKLYSIPVTHIAKDQLGKVIVSNIVALGAIATLTNLISKEALEKTVLSYVPEATKELNRKALLTGFRAGEEALKAQK